MRFGAAKIILLENAAELNCISLYFEFGVIKLQILETETISLIFYFGIKRAAERSLLCYHT